MQGRTVEAQTLKALPASLKAERCTQVAGGWKYKGSQVLVPTKQAHLGNDSVRLGGRVVRNHALHQLRQHLQSGFQIGRAHV